MLKLFVWTDFDPDYTGGLAVAIAETEEQARAMVSAEHTVELTGRLAITDWGDLAIYPLDKPCTFSVSGGS